jgi:hypothetical protein
MCTLEEWRHFLTGAKHKFKIWTDHKNLEYFMSVKKLNHRQARWSLYLSHFDFVMHHRPGTSMGKCNTLSRCADHGSGSEDNWDITLLRPEFFAICALEGVTFDGPERDIAQDIRSGIREGVVDDMVAKAIMNLSASRGRSLRADEWRKLDSLCFFLW